MIKKSLTALILLALNVGIPIVHAEGDSQAGKQQSATCAGCHGSDGNSMMPTFPKLAGQHRSYLFKQLHDFKENIRHAPMMAPFAMGLSEQAMQDLASFYSAQKVSVNPMPKLKADDYNEGQSDAAAHKTTSHNKSKEAELNSLLTFGGDLYRNGDLDREVSACIACHGPKGEGNKPASFPMLKGQHADYLIQTLTDYKTGTRTQKAENIMHMIAVKMTEKEIRAVAYYISIMN